MTRFSYLCPVLHEVASCDALPWQPASLNGSGRLGRFSRSHSTRPSLDRPDALGESIAKGISAIQDCAFRAIWLKSEHIAGALFAC